MTLDEALEECARQYLANLLEAEKGHVTRSAKVAGRNRTEFYKLLHRHRLDPAAFRDQKPDSSQQPDETPIVM